MPRCCSIVSGSLLSHRTMPRKSGAWSVPGGVSTEGVGEGTAVGVGRECTRSGPVISADTVLVGVGEGAETTQNRLTRMAMTPAAADRGSHRKIPDGKSGFTSIRSRRR